MDMSPVATFEDPCGVILFLSISCSQDGTLDGLAGHFYWPEGASDGLILLYQDVKGDRFGESLDHREMRWHLSDGYPTRVLHGRNVAVTIRD